MNTPESYFLTHRERFLSELSELLRIPSVSTDPTFRDGCERAASWVSQHLSQLGFSSEIINRGGHPVVWGERGVKSPGIPTLLFYGHYDVQPIDPIELWETDPFTPTIRNNRIYARGAQDNKGQLFYVLKAIEYLGENSPLHLKVLIEGEEEIGSERLTQLLPELKERVAADVLLVCDTGTPDPTRGAITVGLRGIGHFEVKLTGPCKDLHSGVHGGVVKNPVVELSRCIASLHDSRGRIAVEGFYDGMTPVTSDEKHRSALFDLPDEIYSRMVGVLPTGGEQGIPLMERRGLHPTVEVNGMYGGYLGEGSKTIIPSFSVGKFSCRLVAGQDPHHAIDCVIDHLRTKSPPEMHFEVTHRVVTGGALKVPLGGPCMEKAEEALSAVMGSAPIYLWEGASIPLIASLAATAGATPLLVGFGLEEDNIHAPNESFSLEQFQRGFLFVSRFLASILRA